MGFLLNAEWNNGMGMEDLSTWGTDPLYQFLEMFDEFFVQGAGPKEGDHPFGVFLYYQMKNILMDMDKVIYRFLDEVPARRAKADNAKKADNRVVVLDALVDSYGLEGTMDLFGRIAKLRKKGVDVEAEMDKIMVT